MNRNALGKIAVAAGLVGAGGWFGFERMYASGARELNAELDELQTQIRSYESVLSSKPSQDRWLAGLESRLVGGALDELDNGLRVAIRRVAEQAGLSAIEVGTNSSLKAVVNPYTQARSTARGPVGRALSESPGFASLVASLGGEGSLDAVLGVIAGIEAQPWIHRIDRFTIDPVDKSRTRYAVDVTLRVGYTPGGRGMEPDALRVVEPTPERTDLVGTITERSPFVHIPEPAPAPAPAARVEETAPPPPPPPPPYDQWRVWGLVSSRLGPEVGVRNERTGRSLTLAVGARVPGLAMRFMGISEQRAVFELEGRRYAVELNARLDQRTAIDRVDDPEIE